MNRSIIIFPVLIAFICFSFKKSDRPLYDKKFVEGHLCYIPSGSFQKEESTANGPQPDGARKNTFSIESFYLFDQEITNGFYMLFVNDVKAKGDTAMLHRVLPDTLVWRTNFSYNEPYVDYYLRHPAYWHYPVVGVSHEQCILFCEWLTKWYNQQPGRKYSQVKFDLPSEMEWEYAASGGAQHSIFPWGGYSMQNHEKKHRGQWMANFRSISQASVIRREIEATSQHGIKYMETFYVGNGPEGSDRSFDITAPVQAYWPNAYGLYNMSGNVEEFVKEKGISKGGSWNDPGAYLCIQSRETYTRETSSERGFRIAMKVLE